MKRKTSVLIMASVLTLASASAFSAETKTVIVNGGTVHFEGELVNAACAVNVGSDNQTVSLGQRRTATLAKTGDSSDKVGFNIQLDDCDTTVANNASVAFTGVSVTGNLKVLAITSSGAGSATNVGIQILDNEGKELSFDGSDYSTARTLNNGTNILPFAARYYALDATTPGVANADATFVVKYE